MTDITREDIQKSLLPKVDHLTYEHVKTEPVILCVARVVAGPDKRERPVRIDFEPHPRCVDTDGKPLHFLPCKGMRRVLVEAWGLNGREDWIGKSMELFGNPEVMFGGKKVGGIQISRLSHIKPLDVMLTVSRGRKEPFHVEPLPTEDRVGKFRIWLESKGLTEADATERLAGRTLEEATDEDWKALRAWAKELKPKEAP